MSEMPQQQELATEILTAIRKDAFSSFDMRSWVSTPPDSDMRFIEPGKDLPCGTTLCIAGWAAYLRGWKLSTSNGLAYRGRVNNYIEVLAEMLLELPRGASLLYLPDDAALACLHRMAGGERFSELMAQEEWPRREMT